MLKNLLTTLKSGKMEDVSDWGYTPQQIYKILKEEGYTQGDIKFITQHCIMTEFTKKETNTIRVWSNALTFEIKISSSEPCNYFVDFL